MTHYPPESVYSMLLVSSLWSVTRVWYSIEYIQLPSLVPLEVTNHFR